MLVSSPQRNLLSIFYCFYSHNIPIIHSFPPLRTPLLLTPTPLLKPHPQLLLLAHQLMLDKSVTPLHFLLCVLYYTLYHYVRLQTEMVHLFSQASRVTSCGRWLAVSCRGCLALNFALALFCLSVY